MRGSVPRHLGLASRPRDHGWADHLVPENEAGAEKRTDVNRKGGGRVFYQVPRARMVEHPRGVFYHAGPAHLVEHPPPFIMS